MPPLHPYPYYFYIQRPLEKFWAQYGTHDRDVLFIYGAGFDPRCVEALKSVVNIFRGRSKLETFGARFINARDEFLKINRKYTRECLSDIRRVIDSIDALGGQQSEVEVDIFEGDRFVGDRVLIKSFLELYESRLDGYTDIIVDISAFPRTLMFALLSHLWRNRRGKRLKQNLFAVLTEAPMHVRITEAGHQEPTYMWGGNDLHPDAPALWIPVLGGEIKRFEKIYEALKPIDVLPIVPFPAANPRVGDDILLEAKKPLFHEWGVSFTNVMYASGEIPFDVFRKIQDIVYNYKDFAGDISIVVSALSGRCLSLGVLLAALWSDLYLYHAQPTTYKIDPHTRESLVKVCDRSTKTIYWLDGELYDL